jgi:hypothetical protein
LEELVTDWRIVLKLVFKKMGVRMWAGFMYLRVRTIGRLF